jgi:hypothetical protein
MKKIIVFGFPHCGTSIMKSIIGHIEGVEEIYSEKFSVGRPSSNNETEYKLCKWPFTEPKFFKTEYDEYIKIFIVRNPLYVFSSINNRVLNEDPGYNHSVDHYIDTIKHFNYYKENNKKNLYLIRYEDLFDNNYKNIKDIFNSIGFNYTDKIFENSNFVNKIGECIVNPLDKSPVATDHLRYRTWQLNQNFENNNGKTKINLTSIQRNTILKSVDIKKSYPNIINCIK